MKNFQKSFQKDIKSFIEKLNKKQLDDLAFIFIDLEEEAAAKEKNKKSVKHIKIISDKIIDMVFQKKDSKN